MGQGFSETNIVENLSKGKIGVGEVGVYGNSVSTGMSNMTMLDSG